MKVVMKHENLTKVDWQKKVVEFYSFNFKVLVLPLNLTKFVPFFRTLVIN